MPLRGFAHPMRARQAPGFTLLELLVAMAVLSLLVVLLMGLVDSATKLWRVNENRVESYREARAALHMITTELGTLFPSTNTNLFLLLNTSASSNSTHQDSVLAFLTSLPLDAQDPTNKSDLCSVGYFLAKGRVSDIGPQSRQETWNLYRYIKESNATFAALTNNSTSPDLWPASWRPENGEILARNIRSFHVRGFKQTGNSWTPWTQSAASPLPDLLEIEIEAVNSEFAKRMDGDIKANTPDIAEHSRRWVTRVPLRQPVPQ